MIDTILLIDDDNIANYLHKRIIGKSGYVKNISIATNGQDGLKQLQALYEQGKAPAIILLDLKMPVMDGFAFLETYYGISRPPELPDSKIIVLSSSSYAPDMERLRNLGITTVLEKPLVAEKLNQHFVV